MAYRALYFCSAQPRLPLDAPEPLTETAAPEESAGVPSRIPITHAIEVHSTPAASPAPRPVASQPRRPRQPTDARQARHEAYVLRAGRLCPPYTGCEVCDALRARQATEETGLVLAIDGGRRAANF